LETEREHGILQTIATLFAKGATGKLEVLAGATAGTLFFKDGKLVDARLGHLTGFQAINALAAMPDAHLRFDPSVVPPLSSSINASERLVLKQFFGIETVDATRYAPPASVAELEETTLIKRTPAKITAADIAPTNVETHMPAPILPSRPSRSWLPYAAAFALSVLVIAIVAGAVFLRREYRERSAKVAAANAQAVEAPTTAVEELTPAAVEEPAPATASTPASADLRPNLNGTWNVVNTVRTTSYKSFQNLQIGFVVSIRQNGSTFTATGRKVSENGHSLPAGSRTPIQLRGTINGDTVEATFFEDGAQRRNNGRFVWKINRNGAALTGTFATTAARSSGKSTAQREI
jgi:hypothetical protein